jgi:hypothetical protein
MFTRSIHWSLSSTRWIQSNILENQKFHYHVQKIPPLVTNPQPYEPTLYQPNPAVAMQQVNKQTPTSMQWSRYCWTITMKSVFSTWSMPRTYKQNSLKPWVVVGNSCQQFSWEFRCGVLICGQWHDHESWGISIVKIRYQETASENTAKELLSRND